MERSGIRGAGLRLGAPASGRHQVHRRPAGGGGSREFRRWCRGLARAHQTAYRRLAGRRPALPGGSRQYLLESCAPRAHSWRVPTPWP